MNLTERQKLLLKYIIDEYSVDPNPISSKLINKKYFNNISSQTIRLDMAVLEKNNLIEKPHTSAGRIPSIKGYEYYDTYLLNPIVDKDFINKLKVIFDKRENDINNVINETLNILNEVTGLVSLSTSFNICEESLRQISLIQLDEENAVIIIVSNLANIHKTLIKFQNENQIKDLQVCMKIFNEHLIGVNFSKINDKLESVKDIIKHEVLEYEFITREILFRMFSFVENKSPIKRIVGLGSILTNNEFKDINQLKKVVEMIEKGNIWDLIDFNLEKNSKSKVVLHHTNDLPICVSSTSIQIGDQKHQISVVGPNRVNINQVKGILEYLNNKLEQIFNNKKDK